MNNIKDILMRNKILTILVSILIVISIACIVTGVLKNNKKTQESEIVISNMKDNKILINEKIDSTPEVTGEEISIEELEEFVPEESEEIPVSSNSSVNSGKPYYIQVNYGANVVTIYEKDDDGEYTVPVKAMICSTGIATPTSGVYAIKGRWEWLDLFGDVYGHYSTQIVGNILFHSVPYLEKWDPSSLEYWEYDKLGTSCSAGCIRLTVRDAKWIYNNVSSGTLVEFYSSDYPGPLGKPSAQKISSNTVCRDWDPTDDDGNNPWHNYNEEEEKQKEEEKKKQEEKQKEEEKKKQEEKQKEEEKKKEEEKQKQEEKKKEEEKKKQEEHKKKKIRKKMRQQLKKMIKRKKMIQKKILYNTKGGIL